ncbi:MAG: hypothetical protein EU548_04015 [Promethearchaeota archaeon]|nr:MAG: hypothetical protein EU548_04015 [Candidatus Lokiarchaeota archaeon]
MDKKEIKEKPVAVDEESVSGEISNLENAVKGALTELTDLESRIVNLIKPKPPSNHSNSTQNREANFLMAVRRFQNAMTIALIDGFNKMDIETFNEGFNFFENAITMLASTGNEAEIEQIKSELAQTLIKIVVKGREAKNEELNPFIIKSCQYLSQIYESFGSYETAMKYHGHLGFLLSDEPLLGELEYFQAIINCLLLNSVAKAHQIARKLTLRNFQKMAESLINSVQNQNTSGINNIKKQIKVLGAQRKLDVQNTLHLLDQLIGAFKTEETSPVKTIDIPSGDKKLTEDQFNKIKSSLTHGIEKLQSAHPDIKISSSAPQIDTNSIIKEIKTAISAEISREIRTLSDDIVSKIIRKIPANMPTGRSQPRSGGPISDDGVPDIQIAEGADLSKGEKPKRPKLDDMLNNIIVSE